MAFNIRDKVPRVPQDPKYKFTTKQPVEEIKKQAQEVKTKRVQDKVLKDKEEQEKY